MAEEDLDPGVQMARAMREGFQQVNENLRLQQLASEVREYDRMSPSKYRTWRKETERFAISMGGDYADYRYICQKTLVAAAGREYRRNIEGHPNATWDQIQQTLGQKYDDPDRSRAALFQLFSLRQRNNDLCQQYCDRIITLSEAAYPPADRGNAIVQSFLAAIFVNGLLDEYMHRHLLEANPDNLNSTPQLYTPGGPGRAQGMLFLLKKK